MKPKRKRDFTGMFIMAVLLSFILPLGYLVVRIVSHGGGTEEVRSREDYVLMLFCSAFWALPPLCCRCGSSGRKRCRFRA